MIDTLTLNCQAFHAYMKRDMPRAEELYRAVLEIDPNNEPALRYLGEIVGQQGRGMESIPLLAHALEARKDIAATWLDYGQALQTVAQTEAEMVTGMANTLTGIRMAEETSGNVCSAGHYNLGLGLLKCGDWKRGWAEYEHGYLTPTRRALRTRNGQLWKGQPIPGKTLFVYWEQGLGDTVCWSRYLPLIKERSQAKIMFEVQRDIYPLFQTCTGPHSVCEAVFPFKPGEPEIEFDYRISLKSVMNALGIASPADGPNEPYLKTDRAPWPLHGNEYKVGVCWQGNKQHDNDKNRSISERIMLKAHVPGVEWYSLTYGEPATLAIPLAIKSWSDTLAYLKRMDLLITVDTCIAHVAGAMGKPVWLLLPYVAADYRWGFGDTTPLYPTARLFRQRLPGDWVEVMERVADALTEKIGQNRENLHGLKYKERRHGEFQQLVVR